MSFSHGTVYVTVSAQEQALQHNPRQLYDTAFDYLPTSEPSRILRPPCLKKNVTSCDGDEMKTNYNTLRMPDLRALMREHELRGYSRLRKAELITFLRDNLRPMPPLRPSSKPIPAPRPPSKHIPALRPPSKPMLALRLPQSVKLQPKCIRPPKPMRLPPPPPENSFNPY